MKYNLPYIINLPPFMFRGIDIRKLNMIQKFIFILKGKLLGFIIKNLNKNLFCKLINLFYRENSKIYFEKNNYKKNLENVGTISYPNKRILRMVNNFHLQLEKLYSSYCLDYIDFEDNDVVIDCGANVGELNMSFKLKKKNVNYIAFEPDLETFNCLKLNNPEPNNIFYNKALSNKTDEEEFYIDNLGGNSSLVDFGGEESVLIPTVELDKIELPEKIKLLKIDAEGFEPEVLSGSLNTLPRINYISVDYGHERGKGENSTIIEVNKILYSKNFELVEFSEYRLIGLYENKEHK
jgi:FkbM family methyltransferase